jgi:hypothetical protein
MVMKLEVQLMLPGCIARLRFLNPEEFGTIRAVQPFNRFPLETARNRLQNTV